MAREDKFTTRHKNIEFYSDFLSDFSMNPFTGALARATNEEAVKQSLTNLMKTREGERFYNSKKGCYIWNSMFELFDPSTIELLNMKLHETVKWEPRAVVHDIRISENLDANGYDVTLIFSIKNIPNQTFDLTIPIIRVR